MEAPIRGATGSKTRSTWTDREVAFVLNFADVCLRDQTDFKTHVIEEFLKFAGREVTATAIQTKMNRTLAEYGNTKCGDLAVKGTQSLEISRLPTKIVEIMREQRKGLGLGELDMGDKSNTPLMQGTTTSTGETMNTTRLKRKASTHDSQGPINSHSQYPASDSEASARDNSTDSDFSAQPARKKQKKNATVHSRKRKISATDIDDLSSASPPPPAAKRRPSKEKTPAAKAPGLEPAPQSTQTTRNAIAPSENEVAAAPSSATLSSSAEDETALAMVKDLSLLVSVIMREQARLGSNMTRELENRLERIRRAVEQRPGTLLEQMLVDLHCADKARADQRDLIAGLIIRREFSHNSFPRAPDDDKMRQSWKAIRDHVQHAFGYVPPHEPAPSPEDAGYVAARIDDLAKNQPTARIQSPEHFIAELAPCLESPHVVQAVIGALLFQWLFSGPESLCQDVYSTKELKLFETLLIGEGPARVQQFDKIGMKLLFEDESFQEMHLKDRASKLLASLEVSIKEAWPDALGFTKLHDPQTWAETAIKFKQTLMIDANDYRIHYCRPGTPFDSTWMQAEDTDGFRVADDKAQTKKVATCLFPALFQHEARPFGDHPILEELLVSNKTFFPTLAEKRRLDTQNVVAKAAVLVL